MLRTHKFRLYLVACLLVLVSSSFVISDLDFLERIQEKLTNYDDRYSLEKVYVQTDRDIYSPGDDIWFKVYVRDFSTNLVAHRSKSLTVALVAPDGRVSAEKKIPLDDMSQAQGAIELLDFYQPGEYELFAFTSQMEYHEQAPVFKKRIRIASPGNFKIVQNATVSKKHAEPGDSLRVILEINTVRYKEDRIDLELTTDDEVIRQISAEIVDGFAQTEIVVPSFETFAPKIRLFGRDYKKNIFEEEVKLPTVNPVDLQFFPVGGYAVQGISGEIAFKAINEYGEPVDFTGTIFDPENKKVKEISTANDGMGRFDIQMDGSGYRLEITDSSVPLLKNTFSLPVPRKSGFVMDLNVLDESIEILLNGPEDLIGQLFHMTVIQNGQLISGGASIFEGEMNFSIPLDKERMRTGIAKVSLFDLNEIVRNERLIFIHSENNEPKAKLKRDKVKKRDEVKFTLDVPENAEASMTVFNSQFLSGNAENIMSEFLLSSELKGQVVNPRQYFDRENKSRKEHLDLVMLTNGWRSYEWQDILYEDQQLLDQRPEFGKWLLTNRLGRPLRKRKAIGMNILTEEVFNIQTDEKGMFDYGQVGDVLQVFVERNGIQIQTKVKPVLEKQVNVEDQFGESGLDRIETSVGTVPYRSSDKYVEQVKDLKTDGDYYELPEVIVEGSRYFDPDQIKDLELTDDYLSVIENRAVRTVFRNVINRTPDIIAALRRVRPGIQFNHIDPLQANEVYASRSDKWFQEYNGTAASANSDVAPNAFLYSNSVLFSINGRPPTPDFSQVVLQLPVVNEIVSITYGSGAFGKTLSSNAENGIFIIYTEDYFKKKDVDVFSGKNEAVLPVKSFYHPKYTSGSPDNEKDGDGRKTLFWDPELVLSGKKMDISFYANDVPGDYILRVEGITSEGEPFFIERQLEIVK